MLKEFKKSLTEKILHKCEKVASSCRIVAACIYGVSPGKILDEIKNFDVLLVVEDFKGKVKSMREDLNGVELDIIISDKDVFEKDIKNGFLGDFISDMLLTSYIPILNSEYLRKHEIYVKTRVLKAILENLVLEYPELCHEILIKPEYFIYELARRKAKIFPPIKHSASYFFKEVLKVENFEPIMEGFRLGLKELEKEGIVETVDGYIRAKVSFINKIRKQKMKIIFRKIQRKALRTILDLIPETSGPFIFEELTVKGLKSSEKYLYIPTSMGPVSLDEKVSVEEFVSRLNPNAKCLNIKLEEIGGILNSVYLLKIKFEDKSERRIVVKKFKDWLGLKWFPVTLWTLGTKSFAVLGESRLEREYAINKFLQSKGFNVPEILYASPKEGLIFQEYIDGVSATRLVKQIFSARKENLTRKLEIIRKIGAEIAKIHAYNVCIGDCKPENILVTDDDRIFFVDLEQASRDGDKAWDIAEFLYYSGHYALPTTPINSLKNLTKSFIEGYLSAGGDRDVVRAAGSAKYTKVFSIFALPHVILTISNLCKEMGGKQRG